MRQSEIFERISRAIEKAPRNAYVAELHVQVLKYAHQLDGVSGREFCEGVGLKPAWGTEFVKMRKIAPRLIEAGLDVSKI
ncbi:HTH-like domain-containing protein [Parerythrobacter aestuarii]|uniref:HTH-like domain-containing protein n=1 Tax=Parerythrobacter aestuarii TaxID=3020909 RepID=UPI0024DE8F5D|nr:transcription factor [Parerythrobacter aestuarii]